MKDLGRSFLSIALSCFLLTVFFPASQNVGADGETERTYPSSVTVTYGTAAGVLDNVVGADGITYDVAEEDVGVGRTYTNTTLNPNGPGSNFNWFIGIGPVNCDGITHWGCVDEGLPHDAGVSIVWDDGAGGPAIDTYALEDYTLAAGYTIDEVRVYNIAKNQVAGAPWEDISMAIQSGVTLDLGAPNTLEIPFVEYVETWALNPDTGLAWTDPNIDALEAGSFNHAVAFAVDLTLVYIIVQSSAPIVDYTADYRFDFAGIDFRQKPRLEITGYRTGDVEAIQVEVLRAGTWVTLDADVFTAASTTTIIPLSTADIPGGSGTVRIIDANPTDDVQSTIFIDQIRIITEGGAGGTAASITVYTKSEYKMWENRLKIDLMWYQTGGPEEAVALARWVSITIDGRSLHPGLFQMPTDKNSTHVRVPWNVLDGNMHNITVVGYVSVGWSSGAVTYQSDPETITVDNLIRFIVIMLAFIFLIVVGLALVAKRLKDRSDLIESRDRRENDSS